MLVSVVVPVYNSEKFLDECIQSVLNQDFEGFELILVNDGSTDQSGTICDRYGAADQRVKVIHKKNGGVSSARNLGIDNAIGEWITFVDSDDQIQEDYFKALDVINTADWIHLDVNRQISSVCVDPMNFQMQNYTLSQFLSTYSLYPHFPEVWAKFFRRNIIEKNKIRFDTDLKFGEDSVFNLQYLRFCSTIHTSNVSKYIYRNEEGVLSKLDYDITNDLKLFRAIEIELHLYQYPTEFCFRSIKIPLARYLKILYYDPSILPHDRRKLLKECVEKYYRICLEIYSHPKIRPFFVLAYHTKYFLVLDYVLSKLHQLNPEHN